MGRPPKAIDWKRVEFMMRAGCPAEEICEQFYIHRSNFHKQFKKEFGENFENFATRFRSAGRGNLREKQFAKAIQGSTKELDKLCDIELGQKDLLATTSVPLNQVDITKDHKIMELEHKIAVLLSEAAN